jgi:hypothetical protein
MAPARSLRPRRPPSRAPARERFAFAATRIVAALAVAAATAIALGPASTGTVRAQAARDPALPSFAQLEADGAVIGEIRVVTGNVFDVEDPRESAWPYRWANAVRIRTRPEVIEHRLLFRSGEPLSARRIEETERLLRGLRMLYDVRIRPIAVRDRVVDIEVATRDTWTLYPEFGLSRSGGENAYSVAITDYNLLGTGVAASLSRFSNVDRSGTEFSLADDRAFGGRLSIGASLSGNDDGERWTARIARPFWSLDERWSASLTASGDDRIDSVYRAGEVSTRYRRRQDRAELLYGVSSGVVDGWVRRWSVGLAAREDAYAIAPGFTPPPVLPEDETLVGPFVRWDLIEDRFRRAQNLDQVGRPEFVALGLSASVQVGRAMRALGSTGEAWLYSVSLARGFEPAPSQMVVASGTLSGRLVDGRIERQSAGARLQVYLPQDRRWLLYASLAGDLLTHPEPLDTLTLGGDTGLRGFPLRWQAGTRRVLFTLEERFYTDAFPLRLFRVGAAGFVDVGRAWGGEQAAGNVDRGWIADVGFGLRIFSTRTAVPRVAHVDVAFPIGSVGDIRRAQLIVRSKTSF